MKEHNWNDCKKTNTARTITPDPQRAQALEETAHERLEIHKEITPKNSNFVFEDYYTSLLELLQAHAFRKGHNILNHKCIAYYLRDELKRTDLYELFNDARYKRNNLTYYGNRMDHKTAEQAIQTCKKIIQEITSTT